MPDINRQSPAYRAGYLEALAAFGSILNVHAKDAPRREIPGLEAASRVAVGMYERNKEEWEGDDGCEIEAAPAHC